jgi:cell division protein FtsB
MRGIIAALVVILALLQYKLWIGNGSFAEVYRLDRTIAAQKKENAAAKERNLALQAEVYDLKHGMAAMEERARSELGMIKKDETFFRVIDR